MTARRHWLLLTFWASSILTVVIASIADADDSHIGVPLLLSPILALVTLSRVFRRTDREPLIARGWSIGLRVLAGLSVALAIGGLVGTASRIVDVGGATRLANGPVAVLFLLALIGSYRALVQPTPRNVSIPAVLVHVAWIPLVLVNQDYEPTNMTDWQQGLMGLGLLGLLGTTALLAMLALGAFTGERPRVPEARQL